MGTCMSSNKVQPIYTVDTVFPKQQTLTAQPVILLPANHKKYLEKKSTITTV